MSLDFNKRCCNPLDLLHSTNVHDLRPVPSWMRSIYTHINENSKICSKCRKKVAVQRDSQNVQNEEISRVKDSTFILKNDAMEYLNKCLVTLDEPPINFKKEYSEEYNRGKMERFKNCNLEKIFGYSPTSNKNQSNESEFVSTLKKEYEINQDRVAKNTCIKVLPKKWSFRRIKEEVPSSTLYSIRKTRGNIHQPSTKIENTAKKELNEKVVNFYCNDMYSRIMPGKKDYKSIKIDGKRVHAQKRFLLLNLNELYAEFREKYPNVKVGFSKFALLRPEQCVLAGSSGTHSVCVCVIHQNMKLMCEGAFKYNAMYNDYHIWMNMGICVSASTKCYFRECSECPGFESIRESLRSYFENNNIQTVTYNQWTSTDRSNLLKHQDNVVDFIQKFLNRLPKLLRHSFITKEQNKYFNNLKENLNIGEILVVMDFSENYSFTLQDEVQSFHWSKGQITVHPFAIYYTKDGQLKFTSYIVISDSLKHNSSSVKLFISKFIKFAKENVDDINKILYFSDGCAAQYKNKTNMYYLSRHKTDYGIEAEWNFFATAHGKNVCDGLGGTVKRLVLEEEYVANTTPVLKALPQTQLVHHVCPVGIGKVITKYFSSAAEYKTHIISTIPINVNN